MAKPKKEKQRQKKATATQKKAPAKRAARPFPASGFEEAMEFAKEIYNFGSGQSVRRLSLFDHIKKSPDSGPSRQLISNANRYGLIKGNYTSEQLELTSDGTSVLSEEVSQKDKARAKIKLAIEDIEPFNALYNKFINTRLPARAALIDAIKEAGVSANAAEEGVDTFIVNLRYVGLLQTLSGAERVVSKDHVLDNLSSLKKNGTPLSDTFTQDIIENSIEEDRADFNDACFYITPIGEADSLERKHSDLFLGSIIEPALATFKLKVIRADAIDKPGMITRQIIEYILRSKLVIADLSFHNPNVFYELALRHAAGLPIVQIVRKADKIPFDVNQMRTIVIDDSDIYTLVPKIETYRSEVSNQVRRSLEEGVQNDNPISIYFPDFSVKIE